jgi:transcriptional regulator with XRE-family HTH domain
MRTYSRTNPYPKLREMRMLFSYKQEYVAEVLGISQAEYSRLENGRRNARVEDFKKLAQIYKVSPTMLMVAENYNYQDLEVYKQQLLEETKKHTQNLVEENKVLQVQLKSSLESVEKLMTAIQGIQEKLPINGLKTAIYKKYSKKT